MVNLRPVILLALEPDATEAMHNAALKLAERYGEAAAARLLRLAADEIEAEPQGRSPKSCDYCGRTDRNCENEAQVIGCPPLPF